MSDLVMKEMPDEVLIYDLKHHKAHCLNQTAALVWRHCDGETSITVIAQALSQELRTTIHEEVVWITLEQLSRSQLLAHSLSKPAAMANVSLVLVLVQRHSQWPTIWFPWAMKW